MSETNFNKIFYLTHYIQKLFKHILAVPANPRWDGTTACWDAVNGKELVSAGTSPADYNGTTQKVGCLFDMSQCRGQYVRVGIVIGRYDQPGYYNTINTRELVVYGKYLSE